MEVSAIIYSHVTDEMDEEAEAPQGHTASDWWKSIQTQLLLLSEFAFLAAPPSCCPGRTCQESSTHRWGWVESGNGTIKFWGGWTKEVRRSLTLGTVCKGQEAGVGSSSKWLLYYLLPISQVA